MALGPGTLFGPYEIVGEIGAGGMGVVYRARDTKLDREVAIKVLPESMSSNAERIARFDREAKTLASLNHPNIAQIYGLEQSDGTTALILELVEGPTLADRIGAGPLPADEALGIAMQIAEALEAAHGQGIVHRDLKPANVKLRPDGAVKVLDFGIAKALEPDNLAASGPQSPMLTTPATQVGVILGTAAYMSPEQAKGQPVDQRADIWAFGCLLYEMLTGQLAFGAEDVPTTLARIIANDTDMESLPAAVSLAVRQTIRLCLQKDAAKRVADIRDVRLALGGAFETVSPQVAAAAPPAWRRALPVSAAVVVTGFAVVAAGRLLAPVPEPPPVDRFAYELPVGHVLRTFDGRPLMALSPDGRHFAYNTDDGLYVRSMDELEARLLAGTADPLTTPVFSPDGQRLAYWDGNLKRISIGGGAPIVLAEALTNPEGMSWTADDTILFSQNEGIYRVSANGGIPELIIPADDGTVFFSPELLPDGDTVLYSVWPRGSADLSGTQIAAESLSTGERTTLVEGGVEARYVPTGHLVYSLDDGLFAVAFDADTLTVSGSTVPIVQGVMRVGALGWANFSVSEDGRLVYVTGTAAAGTRALVWVDRQGREEPIDAPLRAYTSPRISPDGTKVVLNPRDQEQDVWIWDLARETLTRLTFDPGQDRQPVWFPDGQRIAFASQQGGGNGDGLYWRAADGTGSAELLAQSDGEIFPQAVLPDATAVIVYGDFTGANANEDIAIVPLDGDDRIVTPLLQTMFREQYPDLSPDGRWVAYTSNESGSSEIYVRPFPDINAGRWQVSTDGGSQPLWARDGQELFYRNDDAMMVVPVETESTFTAGNPEVLFQGEYATPLGGRTYDVTPDGERFLMMKEAADRSEPTRIIVVLNWFTELERLVPTTE